VLRRIEHRSLAGESDPENGHRFVTRRSLDRLLDGLRGSEVVARPLGGLAELDRARDSQIAQMFAESIRERDRIEREEIEQEEREDRERRERERRATG
jgi:hypothetical protein